MLTRVYNVATKKGFEFENNMVVSKEPAIWIEQRKKSREIMRHTPPSYYNFKFR